MVEKIGESEFKEVLGEGTIVVDFSATWCGPCKMLAPVMEELSEEIGDVNFYNIDVDENQDLAMEYGVRSIPAVLVFKGNDKVAETVGFMPKQQMADFINNNK